MVARQGGGVATRITAQPHPMRRVIQKGPATTHGGDTPQLKSQRPHLKSHETTVTHTACRCGTSMWRKHWSTGAQQHSSAAAQELSSMRAQQHRQCTAGGADLHDRHRHSNSDERTAWRGAPPQYLAAIVRVARPEPQPSVDDRRFGGAREPVRLQVGQRSDAGRAQVGQRRFQTIRGPEPMPLQVGQRRQVAIQRTSEHVN